MIFNFSNYKAKTINRLSGAKVSNRIDSLTCGKNGPVLLQDTLLIEELSHFDRERIPERVVHAKGGGAFGYFVITHPEIQKYSKAAIFDTVGKKTALFVRFSQVSGELGAVDTARDPRGFAIKFYTEDGIWDLVGNNTPLFFIRDSMLFPSFIHSQKRNPQTHLKDPNAYWDFLTLRPESLHQASFLFSDRGIPDGWRHMHGFGANTFKLVNSENEVVYCKFHYLTNQGIRNIERTTAERIAGKDPDYAIRDLYNAIASGNYPSWTFYIQVMTFEQAEKWYFNPFDVTKVWPHKEFPLIRVGQLVLNRNPDNYFAQVEQIGFDPANMPSGIEPSPDKLLQGRLFSYFDTQRYRLGTNHFHIPINRPLQHKLITPTIRDGEFVVDDNMKGAPNYFPNSYLNADVDPQRGYKETRFRITGTPDVDRYESDEDDFSQVRIFWEKVLNDDSRRRLVENIAAHIGNAQTFIQRRLVKLLQQVHPDYARGLEIALTQYNSSACF